MGRHWRLPVFLSVIRVGYKIPFYYTPTLVHLRNINSALNYSDFVVSAITDLLKVGSVVECPFPPLVVNPLSVSVQSNGKKKLILDLRHVNFFVKKSKIKFEDAKSFLQCLLARPAAWACSFHIKSGYHPIGIFESDQGFLGFSWFFEGVIKYFKLRFYRLGFLWALTFSLTLCDRYCDIGVPRRSALLFIWTMASVEHKVFRSVHEE